MEKQNSKKSLYCDFCMSPEPQWVYGTEEFEQRIADDKDVVDMQYVGGWSSCDVCRELIENNERVALTVRSLDETIARTGLDLSHAEYDVLFDRVQVLHDEFFVMRTGDVMGVDDVKDNSPPGVVRTETLDKDFRSSYE